jgi:outer membrane receptor protein involved in Fe transport
MRQQTKSETHQVDLLSNPNLLVDQYSKTKAGGGFMFGKAGLDYFATDRLTISAGLVRVHGSMTPTEFMVSDSSWSDGNYQSYSERVARTDRSFNATGFQAGFKQLFKKQGEELTGDVNIFSGKSNYGQEFDTYVYGAKGGVQTGEQFQKIMGNGSTTFTTIQTDYVRPTKTGGKLEAGLRAQLRQMENFQANYFMDGSGSYVKVPSSNTNYENQDNVYAAYLSYSGKLKNFGYKLGLRGESSNYSATLTETNEYFFNKYPISLFPSIFLSQKLKNNQDIQMSYTRRINRPFFMQQIPFIDSSNQLNWTRGNAGLKPEFTNSLEASYAKTYKGNNMFLASVYFKYTTGLITTILDTVQVNGVSHPITTYENANSSYMTGFELTSQNYFTKWWDMNTNLNIYNSKINADDLGINTDAMWSWFAKFNSNFKMPKNYTVQLSGTYQSKTNTPVNTGGGGFGPPGFGGAAQATAQGYIKANWGIDLALKKSFLKNNAASVTLSVNDIFRTRFTQQYTYSSFFTREQTRWPDNPMFRINFSYRFGKMDMSLFKRKNMKQEGESMNGIQM